MASKTIPAPVLGLGIGLLAFTLYKIVKAGSGTTAAGARRWPDGQDAQLRALLQASHVAPTDVARVVRVVPGAVPAPDALTWVRAAQKQGHSVAASENLLDASAPLRLLSDLLPGEEAKLASQLGVAVLPVL